VIRHYTLPSGNGVEQRQRLHTIGLIYVLFNVLDYQALHLAAAAAAAAVAAADNDSNVSVPDKE